MNEQFERMRNAKGATGRKTRSFLRQTSAGPIVEFAIIVPVLLLLLFGIIDFARAFFQQNHLVAAAREGARFAAVQAAPCASIAAIKQRVIDYFPVGGGVSAPAAGNIDVNMDCATPTSPTNIQVEIHNYPYNALTPILRGPSAIQLRARATYRWERSS